MHLIPKELVSLLKNLISSPSVSSSDSNADSSDEDEGPVNTFEDPPAAPTSHDMPESTIYNINDDTSGFNDLKRFVHPTDESEPPIAFASSTTQYVNEKTTPNFLGLAFPWLFWNGNGCFNDQSRLVH